MRILFLVLPFLINSSWAWGPTGHRVVGELATRYLDKKTLLAVKSILGEESLARVSTWPDEIRSDPDKYGATFKWHYSDWPDEKNDYDELNSSGTLIQSLKIQLQILNNPQIKKDKKVEALKFLVHLVGDLHMPLHIGNGKDRGGNDCKIFFHDELTNLHSLWDERMISHTQLSFTELASFLFKKISKKEFEKLVEGDFVDWARESKEIRSTLYPKLENLNYCKKDLEISDSEIPRLSYEYSYKNFPIVERRLFLSAVRLAHLLKQNLL